MNHRTAFIGILSSVLTLPVAAQQIWRTATFTELSPPPLNQGTTNPPAPPIYPTANGNSPQVAYALGAWHFVDGNYFEPRIFDAGIAPNGDFVQSKEDTHFFSQPPSTPAAEYVRALAAGDDSLLGISNLDETGSLEHWERATWDYGSMVPNASFNVQDLSYSPWLNRWFATSLTISSRSTSGAAWSVRRNSTGDLWTGVTAGPEGIVAVSNTGKYTFSANGISWSTGTISSGTTFADVHWADGVYVAVGEGRIYSSTNGTSWFLRRDDPGSGLVSVTHGNKTWVAIQGDGQRIHYSTDGGLNWQDDITISSPVPLSEITFGQGLFVAVGVGGNIRWSPVQIGVVEPAGPYSTGSGNYATSVSSGWSDSEWCASSPADWISLSNIFNDPSGTGAEGLSFSLSANTGAARSACIEVNGRAMTIRQDGPSGPELDFLPAPRLHPFEDAVFLEWDDADGETGYLLERYGLGATAWTPVATLAADEHHYLELNSNFQLYEGENYLYRLTTQFSGGDGSAQHSPTEKYPVTNVDAIAVQTAPDEVVIARNNNFGGNPVGVRRGAVVLTPGGPVNDFSLVDTLPAPHEPGDAIINYTVENIFHTAVASVGAAPVWRFAGPQYGSSEPIAATRNLLRWEPPFSYQSDLGTDPTHPERYEYRIWAADGGTTNYLPIATVNSPGFVDDMVDPEVRRSYRVEPLVVRTEESIGTTDLCPRFPARASSFFSFGPDQTTFLFNWRFSDYNADSWIIERRVNGASAFHTPVEIPATGVTGSGAITGLVPGDLYEFQIGSVWRGAVSGWRTFGPLKTDLETPVIQVITTPGPNQIFINWTDLNGADTYEVQRSLDGTTGWTTIATGLTSSQHTDNTVTALTTYHYRARGVHQWDSSDWSNVVSATPPLDLFVIHNYHDERKFEYVPPPSYTQAILQRDSFSSFSSPVTVDLYDYDAGSPNTIMIDDEVVSPTRYYYRVRFRVGASVVYTDSRVVYTPVEPPTNLSGNPVPDQERVFLSWTASTGAVNYDIERREIAPLPGTWDLIKIDLGTTIYIDETTRNGSTYEYRVSGKGSFPYWQPSRPSAVEQVVLQNSIALWRFDNFGTIENTNDAANMADPDAGGLDNLGELLAGTDPNDPFDDQVLFIEQASTNTVDVTFQLREDYLTWPVDFALQADGSLDGPWGLDLTPAAPVSGTASFFRHTGTLPAALPMKFYRLEFVEAGR